MARLLLPALPLVLEALDSSPTSQFSSLSLAEQWEKATEVAFIAALMCGQWAAAVTTELPLEWTLQLVK